MQGDGQLGYISEQCDRGMYRVIGLFNDASSSKAVPDPGGALADSAAQNKLTRDGDDSGQFEADGHDRSGARRLRCRGLAPGREDWQMCG